jgi:hypothetical protein
MSEVKVITNIEQKNGYSIKSGKNNSSGNADFSSYLTETKSLDDIFEEAAKKYNVPVNLLKAIGKAESNFDDKAVSKCGAQGVMQLMPSTATSLGVTDSFDAEQNVMGGAKYISQLLDKYDGNTSLALAAYNAGSGNVAKYGGIPPFEETQNYVKKVTNYMNQNVETGNKTVTVGNTTTASATLPTYTVPVNSTLSNYKIIDKDDTDAMLQELNSLFSYDDYLNFLQKFMEDNNEKKTDEESNYIASKAINYNVPVMNLLKL